MSEEILVTGGGGFLGLAVCKALSQAGYKVRSYSRSTYAKLADLGVKQFAGDIGDYERLKEAASGCSVFVHTAAKAGIWGEWQDYEHVNVHGTKNCLKVAKDLGITKFLYTSSPSVVFNGVSIEGANEDLAHSVADYTFYQQSKKCAELSVLKAQKASNGAMSLIILRPHLIWGEQDPHFLPRLVGRAEQGRLVKIGKGHNRVDVIHVENAAHAHLLAVKKLLADPPQLPRIYFVSDQGPVNLWEFIDDLLAAKGQQKVRRSIPLMPAIFMGAIAEFIYRLPILRGKEPRMTRFLALQLGHSHFFSQERAKSELGYSAIVSKQEGLARIRATLKS